MKKFWQYLKIIIILSLLYFQLIYWNNIFVGFLFFISYLLFISSFWQTILRRVLAIENHTWLSRMLGAFVIFILLGFTAGIFIVFYKLTPLTIWLSYLIVILLTILLSKFFNKRVKEREAGDDEDLILWNKNFVYRLSLITYFIIWVIAAFLLFKSQSTAALQSPWQTISKYYPPIFFVLTFLSGIFLFVRFKTKTILLILILQCLLLHLYLPLSHQNPWGGDVWRHVAVEERIAGGEQILPIVSEQKLSYGHLWGTNVLLSKTLSVDLLAVNKWLMPILWSFVAPFLFFRIGYLVFDSRRKGLWLAWFALLPFPLQALGSLALPVSFNFLLFLFVLSLWLQYWRDRYRSQKYLALLFSGLMVFGYSLYVVLIWSAIILSFIIYHLSLRNKEQGISFLTVIFAFLSIFIIPVIELTAKVSYVPQSINLWENIKQAIGQFSGWFYASAIRPHDILSGNIIFNHTPDYAFVASIFNNWRWWLIPAMIIIWIFVAFGFYKILNTKYQILGLLFSTVFGGYLLGWFVLDGDRLLTRRLDMVLAALMMILFISGISYLFSLISYNFKPIIYKIFTIISILLFSWFITFTYASGPDMRVVSKDEFDAAKYIEENLTAKPLPFPPIVGEGRVGLCVLADTWVLLPLEALSAGKIVGGGFPIDYNFVQPERIVLLSEMNFNPRESVLKLAREKTGAENCWFVGSYQLADSKYQIDKVFNSQPVQFEGLGVWKETTSTPVAASLKKGKK